MNARLKDLTLGLDGRQIISFTTDGDFRPSFDGLKDKDLDLVVDVRREKRSKDANAYFHVMVNKIARAQHASDSEVKVKMVLEYGALALDADGDPIALVLPASFNVDALYKYVKVVGQREKDGKLYHVYQVYKETHTLNTAEMSRLIEGTISEAKALGIETMTPHELEQLMAAYEARYGKDNRDA
jgi:hypothetical protein